MAALPNSLAPIKKTSPTTLTYIHAHQGCLHSVYTVHRRHHFLFFFTLSPASTRPLSPTQRPHRSSTAYQPCRPLPTVPQPNIIWFLLRRGETDTRATDARFHPRGRRVPCHACAELALHRIRRLLGTTLVHLGPPSMLGTLGSSSPWDRLSQSSSHLLPSTGTIKQITALSPSASTGAADQSMKLRCNDRPRNTSQSVAGPVCTTSSQPSAVAAFPQT